MATAIIGVGNIGKAVATQLAAGGEPLVLAAGTRASAEAAAADLGAAATATTVPDAISSAGAVIFAVGFDAIKELVVEHAALLEGKVVVDPSNPVAPDANGELARTLPEGVSSAAVIAGLLPADAHLVKAFGTLAAGSLASGARQTPQVALFYATDDEVAATAAERLISAAGFAAVAAGGLDQAIRIEMFGELHEFGGLGKPVSAPEARAAMARVSAAPPAG